MRVRPGSAGDAAAPRPQAPGGAAQAAEGAGFRGMLARRIAEAALSWRQALGAQPEWSAAPVLKPRVCPPGLEGETPEAVRVRLHRIAAELAAAPAGSASASLRDMLHARLGIEERIATRMAMRK